MVIRSWYWNSILYCCLLVLWCCLVQEANKRAPVAWRQRSKNRQEISKATTTTRNDNDNDKFEWTSEVRLPTRTVSVGVGSWYTKKCTCDQQAKTHFLPKPKTLSELWSWLMFCNLMSRFVARLALVGSSRCWRARLCQAKPQGGKPNNWGKLKTGEHQSGKTLPYIHTRI